MPSYLLAVCGPHPSRAPAALVDARRGAHVRYDWAPGRVGASAALGVAGAYVVLGVTYYDDLGYLSHPPLAFLALAVVGVPLAAAAAGWLVAGREPPAIARAAIE